MPTHTPLRRYPIHKAMTFIYTVPLLAYARTSPRLLHHQGSAFHMVPMVAASRVLDLSMTKACSATMDKGRNSTFSNEHVRMLRQCWMQSTLKAAGAWISLPKPR